MVVCHTTPKLTSTTTVRSGRSLALGRHGDSHPSGIVDSAFGFGDGSHSLLTSSEDGLLVPIVRLRVKARRVEARSARCRYLRERDSGVLTILVGFDKGWWVVVVRDERVFGV